MGIFTDTGKDIEKILEFVEDAGTSAMVQELGTLLSISLSLMIMIKAWAFLAGKSNELAKDIVFDGIKKLIIIGFAMNVDGWLTLVIQSMEGINTWAGGGSMLYNGLDRIFNSTQELSSIAWKEIDNYFFAGVAFLLIYLGIGIGVLPSFIIIIVTSVTLKLLIMLAPFVIFALFYGFLKNVFTQWLSMFFANTFTVLIITLIFSALISHIETFILFQKNGLINDVDGVLISFQVLVMGILMAVLVRHAKVIAEKLATVSMETTMQSEFGKSLDPFRNRGKKK